jgi:hypothetical protein
MRAPFILQVFVTHLNSIIGTQEVPEIEVADNYEDASVVSRYPPIGALALATAAVTHFLYTSMKLMPSLRSSELSNSMLTARWGQASSPRLN